MKRIFLFLSLILVISCKKEKPKLSWTMENEVIEVYNFSELEPQLNYNDNTTHIVNFWATWCGPCIKELPYFQELHDSYGQNNVKVVLVSLDFPEKLESQLIPFIKKNNVTPQVILLDDPNENSWIPKIDESWSGALPATLIYNKNERAFYAQSFTRDLLFKEVEKFIKH